MGNMSYCRFENTNNDLEDCQMALEDLLDGDGSPLSKSELDAAKKLAATCYAILERLGREVGLDFNPTNTDLASILNDVLECANDEAEYNDEE